MMTAASNPTFAAHFQQAIYRLADACSISNCVRVLTVLTLLSAAPSAPAVGAPAHQSISVAFRLDDCSAISSIELEKRIIAVFQNHYAAFTLGVIPTVVADESSSLQNEPPPMPAEKTDLLRRAVRRGVVEVAQHGYSHQALHRFPRSELTGLTLQNQVERLARGKQLIEAIIETTTTVFIPPWNRYDRNTLLALHLLNFRLLSADRNGFADQRSSLSFLPATCRDLCRVRKAVYDARRSKDPAPIIVVMIHFFDFQEINPHGGKVTLEEFSELVNWLGSQPDVKMLTLTQAAQTVSDLSAERYLRNRRHYRIERWAPRFLRTAYYPESPQLFSAVAKVSAVYAAIILPSAGFAFCFGCAAAKRRTRRSIIGIVGGLGVYGAVIYHFSWNLQLFLPIILLAAVVGSAVGISLCRTMRFRRNGFSP